MLQVFLFFGNENLLFCMLELRILARYYKAEKNIFRVINGMNRKSAIWCGKLCVFFFEKENDKSKEILKL